MPIYLLPPLLGILEGAGLLGAGLLDGCGEELRCGALYDGEGLSLLRC